MTTIGETNNQKSNRSNENEDQITNIDSEEPTQGELDVVTSVFKSFETGLGEGTILAKVGRLDLERAP